MVIFLQDVPVIDRWVLIGGDVGFVSDQYYLLSNLLVADGILFIASLHGLLCLGANLLIIVLNDVAT